MRFDPTAILPRLRLGRPPAGRRQRSADHSTDQDGDRERGLASSTTLRESQRAGSSVSASIESVSRRRMLLLGTATLVLVAGLPVAEPQPPTKAFRILE